MSRVKKIKKQFDILANAFVRKKHNSALRDVLDLQRKIEEFLIRYRIQDKGIDFSSILGDIGRARIDITELAHLAGKTIGIAGDVKGKDLRPLLEQVAKDLENIKRGLFTRTVRGPGLSERLTKLHDSLENLLGAVSSIEYK